nr:HAMP domain-containing sensor histidine kinase [Pedobacter jeongneungensis]
MRIIGVTQLITDKKKYQARKDEFLSVASHELKTPITVLKANLQLIDKLKSKIGDSRIVKLLDSCNRTMEKINVMLNDLLDIGRYSDGKITLNITKFDIREILYNSIQHLSPEKKDSIRINSEPIQVQADKLRIEQVVINLINNAVKYAPESKEIIVNTEIIDNQVKVSVCDFGKGIADGNLHKVFDRYWQEEKKEDDTKGLGLGLYICADIIKKHGGQIGVKSEFGPGSIFWFKIPLQTGL